MTIIGIIGCGLIGQKRAKAAKALGHRIGAVADHLPERSADLIRAVGMGEAVADWRKVIESDAEIVIVATTHDNLASLTLAAVEAGKHVLVEKPAGRRAEEVEPILAAAERRGVLVKAGFNHRFHPSLQRAREIVDSGALGPLLFIRGRYGHGGRPGYDKEWRCIPEISGGGELIDQGSHLIDLSRWFLGDFVDVHGVVPTYFWDIAVDDNCFLSLRTATGQVAWLHASWTEWKNLFCFEICGRDGKLQIDGLGGSYGTESLTWYRMLPGMGPPETTRWEYPFPDKSWDLEFAEFMNAIAERRQPLGNIRDAYENLMIVKRVYEMNQP